MTALENMAISVEKNGKAFIVINDREYCLIKAELFRNFPVNHKRKWWQIF
jgi:hypothetical protein